MPFLSVSHKNFRNLENTSIDLSSKEIFFIGKNGQGKSNIIESLYMAAYGSSFRTKNDSELLTYNEPFFTIRSIFKDESEKSNFINIQYSDNKKKIEKNGKIIKDRKELINTIPCVLFSHEDLEFVVGEPERRRFFIDQTLSLYDDFYIDALRKYKKILKTRNAILKEKKYDLLDTIDIQLIECGIEIQTKRNDIIYQFNLYFKDLYNEISKIDNVHIKYYPSWKNYSRAEILSKLLEKREIDKAMGTTMSGIHRDNIRFFRNDNNFVPSTSMGQRRLIALILRLIQAKLYIKITSKNPILLLDDVLLELDQEKREKIMFLLPEYEQLFCTFLETENFQNYKKTHTKIYNVADGICSE
ncbi:MAG: DNA replication/repair protein RecF [Treponemataceae bacterium]